MMMAIPPVSRTKELVQRFLLMGNDKFQITPVATNSTPDRKSAVDLLFGVLFDRRCSAVRSPSIVVAKADIVLRKPSGSHVPAYRWPGSSWRSM